MTVHTIKGLRDQFKAVGKFHTPPELAAALRALIPEEPRDVYDPTCGAGALLAQFDAATPKYGQDIDPVALADAGTDLENFHGHLGDVLTDPAWLDKRFHAIVANPPFSIKWEPPLIPALDDRFVDVPTLPTAGRADYAFLLHILHMLADDGTAVVLQFPGVLYRGQRELTLRKWLVDLNVIDQVIAVPGNTFTDTAIQTAILVFRKDRAVDATVRFADWETHVAADVSRAAIAAEEYTLTPSRYATPEPEPVEEVAPQELQEVAVAALVGNVTTGLRFQKRVCELEGWDFEPIRDRVREAVEAA